MPNDAYATVTKRTSCAINSNQYCYMWPLQLFIVYGPLGFVAMDILGPIPEISHEIHLILNSIKRKSRLVQFIVTPKKRATHLAKLFLDHWRVLLGFHLTCLETKTPAQPAFFMHLFLTVSVLNTSRQWNSPYMRTVRTGDLFWQSWHISNITYQIFDEIGTRLYHSSHTFTTGRFTAHLTLLSIALYCLNNLQARQSCSPRQKTSIATDSHSPQSIRERHKNDALPDALKRKPIWEKSQL